MEFLTAKQLDLNAAGYLISKDSKKPVNHESFVKQQKAAEYIVKFAEAIKDKNFTASKVDNLEVIKASVIAAINDTAKSYVSTPAKPTSKVQDELVKYALDFVNYEDSKVEASKINEIMNEFNKIDDVESVGDYFTEGVVKLNAIYSIKQILAAVKITSDKLK
jgi:hypothetical protein